MEINEIAETIIGAAIALHRDLGPGLEQLLPIHAAQLLPYLKLSGHHVGFLINFNVRLLRDGLRRLVLDLPE